MIVEDRICPETSMVNNLKLRQIHTAMRLHVNTMNKTERFVRYCVKEIKLPLLGKNGTMPKT